MIVYEEGFTGFMQPLDHLDDPALIRRDTNSSFPLKKSQLLRRDGTNSDTPAASTLVSIPTLPVVTPVNVMPVIGDWYSYSSLSQLLLFWGCRTRINTFHYHDCHLFETRNTRHRQLFIFEPKGSSPSDI
jgi:hypothetical protein